MMRLPFASLLENWAAARRFHALPAALRSIVFYAEDAASWVHFEPIVRELTGPMGREICYLTSDPHDPILVDNPPRIHAFRIGEGAVRTGLFLSLKADVLVMTMPDLETFHIKRSRRHPVHYVYVFHSIVSTHMIYRKGAFDHFDTVLCVGPHHVREIAAAEDVYALDRKTLIDHGYGRLDALMEEARSAGAPPRRDRIHVLIAPSWGIDGLLETRGREVVGILLNAGCEVTVRPHPMTARKWPEAIRAIEREFAGHGRLTLERDIASSDSLASADVMISDWSGAAIEFAFGYEKPVLFVDVPRKVNNPEYERIGCEPLEVSIRERIGCILATDRLADLPAQVQRLAGDRESYRRRICTARDETVYNVGRSGAVGAEAIVKIADAARAKAGCGS